MFQCLDAVKAHQKLVNLGEQLEAEYNIDTEQVDLCRCLYKLHFQLLLLLESFGKLLRLVRQNAVKAAEDGEEVHDRSEELLDIMNNLMKAPPQSDAVEQNIQGEFKNCRIEIKIENPCLR